MTTYLDMLNNDCILEIIQYLPLNDKFNFYYAIYYNKDSLCKYLVDERNNELNNKLNKKHNKCYKCYKCSTQFPLFFREFRCDGHCFYESPCPMILYCETCAGSNGCINCLQFGCEFEHSVCTICNGSMCSACVENGCCYECDNMSCVNIICADCFGGCGLSSNDLSMDLIESKFKILVTHMDSDKFYLFRFLCKQCKNNKKIDDNEDNKILILYHIESHMIYK